jgi:hypothetical protein
MTMACLDFFDPSDTRFLVAHQFCFQRSSKFWRSVCVVCVGVAVSYILFDVLDLDGSNSPFKQSTLERTAIVAEVVKNTAHSPDTPKPLVSVSGPIAAASRATTQSFSGVLIFSRLESRRDRHYRIALPRSAIADPL